MSLVLLLTLTSCDGKNEVMPPTGGLDGAEKLIAGTYVGTWTKTKIDKSTGLPIGDTITASGSVIFTSTEELGNNVVAVEIISDDTEKLDLGAEADASACNVSRLSSGILSIWNVYSLNPFGFTFTGKVSPEGDATFSYQAVIIDNHIETKFQIEFTGHKQ